MRRCYADTTPVRRSPQPLRALHGSGRDLLFLIVALLSLLPLPATAQRVRWDVEKVTGNGFSKSRPQIAIDRWGARHLMWASLDSRHAGVQLYYTSDVTGEFSAAVQVTDVGTGTVFDPAVLPAGVVGGMDTLNINPFIFKLDEFGVGHVAYVANRINRLSLFYRTNRRTLLQRPVEFSVSDSLDEAVRYGMAIDSGGSAHIVWIGEKNGNLNVYYWQSGNPGVLPVVIASKPCLGWLNGCRVGDPAVEASAGGLEIAFRADSGTIYHLRKPFASSAGPLEVVPSPPYHVKLSATGVADLRTALAVDARGTTHILAPFFNATLGYRLIHFDNNEGTFRNIPVAPPFDTLVGSFDLTADRAGADGNDKVRATWTVGRTTDDARQKLGYVELARGSKGEWSPEGPAIDLHAIPGVETGMRCAGVGISSREGRTAVSALWTVGSVTRQVAIFERREIDPTIRYILPDAAAPGMNVVVESYASPRDRGNFGPDGFDDDSVGMELVDRRDTARVVIGPSVVSWEGRLVSTALFVKAGAAPGAVPVRIRVGNMISTTDTFHVVEPQHLGGSSGKLTIGGALGSGGILGSKRSRRGVLVVDSLNLEQGTYTIDTSDTDPETPGNQGFLPAVILSRGPVRIGQGVVLSVSASPHSINHPSGSAGPGGGGGGAAGKLAGGSGYTGGGGAGNYLAGSDQAGRGLPETEGSGGTLSGWWAGGPSLNGAPGGATYLFSTGGGGTGHPFGASGSFGRISEREPVVKNLGARGGGAGGGAALDVLENSWGGGGGAHATPGGDGDDFSMDSSGGEVVGSAPLVPLAGGSGGGAAQSVLDLTNGGGGGGALALISYSDVNVNGRITANGSDGAGAYDQVNSSGGGGGGGGGIVIGGHGNIIFGAQARVQAIGGQGGMGSSGGNKGGKGGDGRIRVDGKLSAPSTVFTPERRYSGPAVARGGSFQAVEGAKVTGFGMPGRKIRVFLRPEGGSWNYDSPVDTIVGPDGSWSITLGAEARGGLLYISAMQEVPNPSADLFTAEPAWVLSPAGGTTSGRAAGRLEYDSLDFGCVRFDSTATREIMIGNGGDYSDLIIRRVDISSRDTFSVVTFGSPVVAGGAAPLRVAFTPRDTGDFEALMTIYTNAYPDSIMFVRLRGCGITGQLHASTPDVDLGDICIGTCRDTIIRVENMGETKLTITHVSTDETEMNAAVLSRLPVTLDVGESADLKLRFCIRNIDDNGARLYIHNVASDSVFNQIRVLAVNAGPDPILFSELDFGNIDLGTDDSCRERTMVIQNRSGKHPLKIESLGIASDRFRLIDPPAAGTQIPPGGQIELRILLCVESLGDFRADLDLTFGNSHCGFDTTVALLGRVERKRPQLLVERPPLRDMRFRNTLVAAQTSRDTIVVHNVGNAPGFINLPMLRHDSGTAAEISIDMAGISFPKALAPGQELIIPVRFAPLTPGMKGAVMLLNGDDRWEDSVTIRGQAVLSGVRLNRTTIDFGDVRVGTTAGPWTIRVENMGTAPDEITRIVRTGDTVALKQSLSHSLPKVLLPATGDSLTLSYTFRPNEEREFTTDETVEFAAGIDVVIRGRGVKEHLAVRNRILDFGCRYAGTTRDSADAVTISNTGTYRMIVRDLPVVTGRTSFQVIGADLPDTLDPGETRSYSVRYMAGTGPALGALNVETSADEFISVLLRGDVCRDDRRMIVKPASVSARIGEHITVPILASLDRPLPFDVDYTLTLNYASDMLVPLTSDRVDAAPPVIEGASSISAAYAPSDTGSITITGRLSASSEAEVLVGIPMKVLHGSRRTTSLTLSKVGVNLPGVGVTTFSALFEAIDCDTTGGIFYQGDYALKQNKPNPFNPETVIEYEIARRERVRMNLYDAMGTLVAVLLDEVRDRGRHELRIDAASLPTGVYTYEIIAGPFRKTKRMVVLE